MKTKSIITATIVALAFASCKKEEVMLPVQHTAVSKAESGATIINNNVLPLAILVNGKAEKKFLYNDSKQLLQIAFADGSKQNFFYDEVQRLSRVELVKPLEGKAERFDFSYGMQPVDPGVPFDPQRIKLLVDQQAQSRSANPVVVIDPAPIEWNFVNVRHTVLNEDDSRNSGNSMISMFFDSRGKKLAEAESFFDSTQPEHYTAFEYDEAGRLIKESKWVAIRLVYQAEFGRFEKNLSELANIKQLNLMPGMVLQTGNPTEVSILNGCTVEKSQRMYVFGSNQRPLEISTLSDKVLQKSLITVLY